MYEEHLLGSDIPEETLGALDDEGKWLDKAGDLGVAEFHNLTVDQIKSWLALTTKDFPFLNKIYSEHGDWPVQIKNFYKLNDEPVEEELRRRHLAYLEPAWHQYVGLAACVMRFFRGLNGMMADGVGVGKTLQCFLIMNYLRHLIVSKASPPPIGMLLNYGQMISH